MRIVSRMKEWIAYRRDIRRTAASTATCANRKWTTPRASDPRSPVGPMGHEGGGHGGGGLGGGTACSREASSPARHRRRPESRGPHAGCGGCQVRIAATARTHPDFARDHRPPRLRRDGAVGAPGELVVAPLLAVEVREREAEDVADRDLRVSGDVGDVACRSTSTGSRSSRRSRRATRSSSRPAANSRSMRPPAARPGTACSWTRTAT